VSWQNGPPRSVADFAKSAQTIASAKGGRPQGLRELMEIFFGELAERLLHPPSADVRKGLEVGRKNM
jgi:hypothetical protein